MVHVKSAEAGQARKRSMPEAVMKAGNEGGGGEGRVRDGLACCVTSSIMRRVCHDGETMSRTNLGEFGFEVGNALFERQLRLGLLDKSDRWLHFLIDGNVIKGDVYAVPRPNIFNEPCHS
jgi:hypothetical protein